MELVRKRSRSEGQGSGREWTVLQDGEPKVQKLRAGGHSGQVVRGGINDLVERWGRLPDSV